MLRVAHENILELLDEHFPGQVTDPITQLIMQQESLNLLKIWHREVVKAKSFDDFFAVPRR